MYYTTLYVLHYIVSIALPLIDMEKLSAKCTSCSFNSSTPELMILVSGHLSSQAGIFFNSNMSSGVVEAESEVLLLFRSTSSKAFFSLTKGLMCDGVLVRILISRLGLGQ